MKSVVVTIPAASPSSLTTGSAWKFDDRCTPITQKNDIGHLCIEICRLPESGCIIRPLNAEGTTPDCSKMISSGENAPYFHKWFPRSPVRQTDRLRLRDNR